MPHGSGHHGHSHGGGGFGGGHHHHHHHRTDWGHRRHHHHTQYYGVGLGPWYYYRRRPLTWVVFSIVVTIVIILSATVTIRFTASDYSDDDGVYYAPTDTRIIPVSNALCQSLELSVYKPLAGYTVTLSMLNSPPKLTGSEIFDMAVSNLYVGAGDYEYYYFYMYPGSHFTVSACISEAYLNPSTFNLIKGHKKFNDWADDPYNLKDSFQINTLCSSGRNDSHVYHVKKEDYYYLTFDSNHYRSTQLNINVSFYRTRYELATNVTTVDTCLIVTGLYSLCSIDVPLSSKTAYLDIVPQSNTVIDWTEGIGLNTKCVPRVWMYVVIAFSILIGVLSILVPVLALVIIKLRKKKSATPAPVSATLVPETETAPLLSSPPTNPNFQQLPPPKYGNDYIAPPEYKP